MVRAMMGKKSEYTVTIEKGNVGTLFDLWTKINGVQVENIEVPYDIKYKIGDIIGFNYPCSVYKGRISIDGVTHDSGYQFVATGKHNIVFLGTSPSCP